MLPPTEPSDLPKDPVTPVPLPTPHKIAMLSAGGLATLLAADASALYARNVLDFLKLIVDKDAGLAINREDEIVAATLLCHGGDILRKQ